MEQFEILEKLDNIIPEFGIRKEQIDNLEKENKPVNQEIKDLLSQVEKDSYSAYGWQAKLQHKKIEGFNEDMLISIINNCLINEKLNLQGIIKTKEYIDYDALENAIYHGNVDAPILAPARTVKEQVALFVKREKTKD